jgi:hypothetical protein
VYVYFDAADTRRIVKDIEAIEGAKVSASEGATGQGNVIFDAIEDLLALLRECRDREES